MTTPPPDPELTRLEPLLGTWRSEEHTQDSVLGPGVPVVSDESFEWLDGGYFMVSTYDTKFGDEPAQRGVNYWGYDSDAGRFRIIFFSDNGPYTEDDDSGKVRVNEDGTISVAWWLRDENGEWQPWMDNRFSKVEG
jgi:hypothetical protein